MICLVDLIDAQEARERLVQSKARHFLELSLQDVTELPDQHLSCYPKGSASHYQYLLSFIIIYYHLLSSIMIFHDIS